MSSEEQDSHCGDEAEQVAPDAVVPGVVPPSNEVNDKEIADRKNEGFDSASLGDVYGIQ